MHNRRLAAALVGGATLAVVVVGSATAATAAPTMPAAPSGACSGPAYPTTGTGSITLSSTTVTPGQSITVTVTGCFTSGEPVTVSIDGTTVVGTTTANQNGTASTTVTIPSNLSPGTHQITVTGNRGDSASTSLTVVSATSTASGTGSGSGTLPFTGAEIAAMSTVGGALLIGGGVAFATGMTRKRRNSTPAA